MDKTTLIATAQGTEKRVIRKSFMDDELAILREKFADNEIQKSEIEAELDELKKDFKARLDPYKNTSKDLITKIRHRYVDETKDVYLLPNHDTNMMEFYEVESGDLVETRKLRPDEKQLRIQQAV